MIDSDVFSGCSSLTIVKSDPKFANDFYPSRSTIKEFIIPESVAEIRGGDLSGIISNLTSLSVAKNNKTYDSREDCNAIIHTESNSLIRGCANTIIPESVTEIGEKAFSYCSTLTNINIPESVTKIGGWAFLFCEKLTSITIPESVTEIGSYAFSSCSSLTGITIPESVTTIGSNAFARCTSLTEVRIPKATNVASDAFKESYRVQIIRY